MSLSSATTSKLKAPRTIAQARAIANTLAIVSSNPSGAQPRI